MDVGACALGSGVIDNAHCCSIIGTAALHEMVIDKPLQDTIKSGMTVSHVMEGKWLRLMAVSYTHLDVYKRQVLYSAHIYLPSAWRSCGWYSASRPCSLESWP